uniref:Uncharacterized protein n=1 Tax=Anguilla anguilla TaxID=7936 RepID=A0A0E9QKE4_ANGAN
MQNISTRTSNVSGRIYTKNTMQTEEMHREHNSSNYDTL